MNPPEIKDRDLIGLNGVGKDQLTHPHFEIWQKFFQNHYEIDNNKKIILFLPCAAIKPYKNSPIHKRFNKVLEDRKKFIEKVVISNAGVIPYRYCIEYPFNSYDWNPLLETSEIKREYIKVTSKRVYKFFKNKDLDGIQKYVTYLRNDSESIISLKKAFKKLDLELEEIIISGRIRKNADQDLLLILEENLLKLDNITKNILDDKKWIIGQAS